jgi:hypothetical protein
MNLKDTILATPFAREKRPVSVPQWPDTEGKLFVENPTALQYDRYVGLLRRSGTDPAFCLAAEVTALVLVDETGQRVFTTVEDIAKLAAGAPEPLDAVFDAFRELVNSGGDSSKKSETPPSGPSST